jgi:hypothetical protein
VRGRSVAHAAVLSNTMATLPFWNFLEADETEVGQDPKQRFGNILNRDKSV